MVVDAVPAAQALGAIPRLDALTSTETNHCHRLIAPSLQLFLVAHRGTGPSEKCA
jgi:hypothetical protein